MNETPTARHPRPTISVELFLDPLDPPELPWPTDLKGADFADTHVLADTGISSGGFCTIRIQSPELVLPESIGELLSQIERHLLLDIQRARATGGNRDISLQ